MGTASIRRERPSGSMIESHRKLWKRSRIWGIACSLLRRRSARLISVIRSPSESMARREQFEQAVMRSTPTLPPVFDTATDLTSSEEDENGFKDTSAAYAESPGG